MATCMPKHHLLYFENGLSRPKSKSYSRLRLDRTKAGKKLPVLPATRDSSSDGQEPSGQDRSTMAATVVAGWGTPAATPAELGASIIPSELVSTWLNCALSRLALPNAHVESEPETGTARRFSEPIVPTATSSNMHNTSSTFDAKLSEEVKIRFSAWKSFQLKHFSEEEKLLMPLTQMLAPTPLGRCRVVHRHLICPSMERSAEEFIHFIGWCTGLLSRHGSDRETPEVATRIFVCALQSVSSAAQWAAFQPVLMYHCKEEIWKMLVTQYNVLLPFGDELLLGTINAEFQGPPPMAFSIMRYSHEAMRVACAEMDAMLPEIVDRYEEFVTALREYRRAMQVHSAMEEYDMFPLLDSVHDSPTGLCDLHLEDDFLWMQLMDAMRDYEEEKSFSANYVVATRAQLLWQSMLASMDHSMAKLDYAVLLDVEKESRRLFWFQSSLGYFCVLQGLRDTGVDTVHRIIFKELRSLLLFLQTADFRTIQLRRLKKATDYYKEHIQMLPIVKVIVREQLERTGVAENTTSNAINSNESKSKKCTPKSVVAVMRWIVSFQMLVEMRIMAAEKKELKRQQQSAPTLTQLLPAAHLLQQLKPKAIEIGESSSYLSHGSKCLLSCDDLFKISEKTKKY